MARKAEYRSAKRSKKLIKKAFAELLHEKDVQKITVTDIIERAGISRGTFYAHYPDVPGLFSLIIDEEFTELYNFMIDLGVGKIISEPELFFGEVIVYLNKDFDYYRCLLLARNNDIFLGEFRSRLSAVLAADENTDPEDGKVQAYTIFFSTALSNVLVSWLRGDIKMNSDELVAFLSRTIRKICS